MPYKTDICYEDQFCPDCHGIIAGGRCKCDEHEPATSGCQHHWTEREETIRDDSFCDPVATRDTQGHSFIDRTIQVTKECTLCGQTEISTREEVGDGGWY